MGGWHIVHRTTKGAMSNRFYTAIATDIKLPSSYANGRDEKTKEIVTFPEFVHGFYSPVANYGLDMGILLRGLVPYLFYYSLDGTCIVNYGEAILVGIFGGMEIRLSTYIENGKIIGKVTYGGRLVNQLEGEFTNQAVEAFKNGAIINREILMASNVTDYIPSDAFFDEAVMHKSTLTGTDGSYIPLSNGNSGVIPTYSDEGGELDENRYSVYIETEGPFVADYGWCIFKPYI